jgi:hypothetical protein
MTNLSFVPISTVRWSVHTRLIPAYCYQQFLTILYFMHAFLPTRLQHLLSMTSDNSYHMYESMLKPVWQHTTVRALTLIACLPLLSFVGFLTLGALAIFWPLLVVGSTCSVISFTGALLTLNSPYMSSAPTKQFAYYLLSLIPLAGLGYIFSPILWSTLFLITAYHSITNPRFSSIPSLSTAGSRWLGLGCGLLLITAPYWTMWHVVTFPLCFFMSWMAQFWTFVGCNIFARMAPNAIDAVSESYSNFVAKHTRSISMEKDHIHMEKTNAQGNGKETYERMQKIEHHS